MGTVTKTVALYLLPIVAGALTSIYAQEIKTLIRFRFTQYREFRVKLTQSRLELLQKLHDDPRELTLFLALKILYTFIWAFLVIGSGLLILAELSLISTRVGLTILDLLVVLAGKDRGIEHSINASVHPSLYLTAEIGLGVLAGHFITLQRTIWQLSRYDETIKELRAKLSRKGEGESDAEPGR